MSDTYGEVDEAIPVDVTHSLLLGTAAGDVPRVTYDPDGNVIGGGTETFSATFTGIGQLYQAYLPAGAFVNPSIEVSHSQSRHRDAEVTDLSLTGMFGTGDLGTLRMVWFFDVHYASILITR